MLTYVVFVGYRANYIYMWYVEMLFSHASACLTDLGIVDKATAVLSALPVETAVGAMFATDGLFLLRE